MPERREGGRQEFTPVNDRNQIAESNVAVCNQDTLHALQCIPYSYKPKGLLANSIKTETSLSAFNLNHLQQQAQTKLTARATHSSGIGKT